MRVLATSREHLGLPAELTWLVPPLAEPQAVTLFAERAQAALSTFGLGPDDEPAVAELCLRLDGMPLAIELAAARVNVFSVEQISTRLDDATRFLGEPGRGTVARQRTLRATLDWSYDLLSPPERALLSPRGCLKVHVDALTQLDTGIVATRHRVGYPVRCRSPDDETLDRASIPTTTTPPRPSPGSVSSGRETTSSTGRSDLGSVGDIGIRAVQRASSPRQAGTTML